MTAGEHYHLKVCILAFIFDLHRSAYSMLWALFCFIPFSQPPFSKLSCYFGFLSSAGWDECLARVWSGETSESSISWEGLWGRGCLLSQRCVIWPSVPLRFHCKNLFIAVLICLSYLGPSACVNAQRVACVIRVTLCVRGKVAPSRCHGEMTTFWALRRVLDGKYCCTVKYTKAQPLVEDACTCQCTPDTWTNLRDWTWELMFASLKVCNLKVHM